MKPQQIHRWLNKKIAKTLPNSCSFCEKSDSHKWVPLLLCESNAIQTNKNYILCGDCYEYYDNCESNYRFWIERNLKPGGSCQCGGTNNG
jgi:hypothetical protein